MNTFFSYTQPYIIVGALIERDGKFLLIEENHAPNKGLWNVPSGKLDFGESPIDCVRREVKEESGLQFEPNAVVSITSIHRQDVGQNQVDQRHVLRIMYTGIATGDFSTEHNEVDKSGSLETSNHKWLSPEEIFNNSNIRLRYIDILSAIKNYKENKLLSLSAVLHIVQS